jgi:pSer/pThr/pTyr-binding forkhead associated (FHA) protein
VASKNGTLVNGHKINGPTRLKPGDRITLCSRQLVFLIRDPRDAQAKKN